MPSRSTVLALLALFAALGGTATAARLIDGGDIRRGTVASKQIRDRTIAQRDLARATIAALRARLTPVRSQDIADGTIALADLAPSSVDGARIADRSITAGDLVTDTITSTELGTGSVGADELGPDSVGNSEIKGNAISRNQLRTTVLRAGSVAGDFGTVPAGECAQQDLAPAGDALPADALNGTAILVGAPGTLPAGVIVDGRTTTGETLVVQVCNLGATDAVVGAQTFPYVAFGT